MKRITKAQFRRELLEACPTAKWRIHRHSRFVGGYDASCGFRGGKVVVHWFPSTRPAGTYVATVVGASGFRNGIPELTGPSLRKLMQKLALELSGKVAFYTQAVGVVSGWDSGRPKPMVIKPAPEPHRGMDDPEPCPSGLDCCECKRAREEAAPIPKFKVGDLVRCVRAVDREIHDVARYIGCVGVVAAADREGDYFMFGVVFPDSSSADFFDEEIELSSGDKATRDPVEEGSTTQPLDDAIRGGIDVGASTAVWTG